MSPPRNIVEQSNSILTPNLTGNLGTVAPCPGLAGGLPNITLVNARTTDGSTIPVVVTLIDFDPQIQTAKIARIIWGGGGVASVSTFIDIGHSRSFPLYCSDIRVDVGHYTPGVNPRIGAFVSRGFSSHVPEGLQAPYTAAPGAGVVVPIQAFCNELVFVPEAGSSWTIQFRRVDTTIINTIGLAAGALPPPIPVINICNDINCINTDVVQRAIMVHQKLHM